MFGRHTQLANQAPQLDWQHYSSKQNVSENDELALAISRIPQGEYTSSRDEIDSSTQVSNGPDISVFLQRPSKRRMTSLDCSDLSDAHCVWIRQWLMLADLNYLSAKVRPPSGVQINALSVLTEVHPSVIESWLNVELSLDVQPSLDTPLSSEFCQTDQDQAQVLAYVDARVKKRL